MQITIRRFEFESAQDPGFKAITEEAAARGLHCFDALGEESEIPQDGTRFEVDPSHLFDNQFNTVEGSRLFDFRLLSEFKGGRRHKRRIGYIVEPGAGFDELQRLRRDTYACGYCGKKTERALYDGPAPHWCGACLDSQYLKLSDLRLLELRPVAEHFPERTAEPPEWLIHRFEQEQREASILRAQQRTAERLEKVERKRANLALEATFIEKLAEGGLAWRHIENLIHYEHTGRFCFGWREALSEDDAREIESAIERASLGAYPIDIKRREKVEG